MAPLMDHVRAPVKVLGTQLLTLPFPGWSGSSWGRAEYQVHLWSPGPRSWGHAGRRVLWQWPSPNPQNERSHTLGVQNRF